VQKQKQHIQKEEKSKDDRIVEEIKQQLGMEQEMEREKKKRMKENYVQMAEETYASKAKQEKKTKTISEEEDRRNAVYERERKQKEDNHKSMQTFKSKKISDQADKMSRVIEQEKKKKLQEEQYLMEKYMQRYEKQFQDREKKEMVKKLNEKKRTKEILDLQVRERLDKEQQAKKENSRIKDNMTQDVMAFRSEEERKYHEIRGKRKEHSSQLQLQMKDYQKLKRKQEKGMPDQEYKINKDFLQEIESKLSSSP
jgi:hypothetical protein